MTWKRTEALTAVRIATDDPRAIEGLAVPYGVMSGNTTQMDGSIGREAFAPGSFGDSVEHWMTRSDGARMAFRPEHGARPNGTVTLLQDTPEGVRFRASIFDGPEGDSYLRDVAAGLNGISIEWGPGSAPSKRMRDGTMLHQAGRLMAIAGSVTPAYDGARIALRDMKEVMDENTEVQTEERSSVEATKTESQAKTPEITQAERSVAERKTVEAIKPAIVVTRAEAIYGPRSGHSYFADAVRAREGDGEAAERQARHARLLTDQAALHERAGDVMGSEIAGALPNEYLPGLLTPRILKGRPMGSFFNRFPISDARPRVFPKVTTSTSVAVQAAEGTNPAASDFATTAETATPLLYGGHTLVSRQVLDSADPSIDAMLMQDLTEAYAQASEAVIVTAVEAGASASGTAITAATPFAGTLGNVIKYQSTRFLPAEGVLVPAALYAVLLAEEDTAGRPKMPWMNPANADGTANAGAAGANLLGADVLLSWGSTANVVVTARRSDYAIFESSLATFRYEQSNGPAQVDIGIWAYLVVGTRKGGLSVTAA